MYDFLLARLGLRLSIELFDVLYLKWAIKIKTNHAGKRCY